MTILRVDTISGIGTTTFGPTFNGNLEFNSQNYIVLPKGSSTQQGVLRTTVDVVGTGGTFYDNLVLAMPFNEATGLRDVSSRNRNPGTYGNVGIATTVSKYYGSSLRLDGVDDYLSVGISSDFYLGTEQFTVEAWVYVSSLSSSFRIIGIGEGANGSPAAYNGWNFFILSTDSTLRWYRYDGTTETSLSAAIPSFATGQWFHFAVTRDSSNTIRLFSNGVGVSTHTSATTSYNPINLDPLFIGRQYDGTGGASYKYSNGHLQDLRVYKGLAKYTTTFTPPDRIAEIGVGFTTGQLRYNTDSNLPELYDGNQWVQLSVSQVGLGTGGNTEPGARGLFTGGYASGAPAPKITANIDYVNIASTGNAISFGSLASGASQDVVRVGSSRTRGVFRHGNSTPMTYVTFASTGNSISFGTALLGNNRANGLSNETRGIYGGGSDPASTVNIDYITIASEGNAIDFGSLITGVVAAGTGASSTRGIFAGGGNPTSTNIIQFITIATLGNSQDFGDLSAGGSSYQTNSASNATRMFVLDDFMIEKIQIQTLGNAVDFGDTSSSTSPGGGCASPTRALFGGGNDPAVRIEYINIATEGNAVSFGDLTYIQNRHGCGTSNAHGGL